MIKFIKLNEAFESKDRVQLTIRKKGELSMKDLAMVSFETSVFKPLTTEMKEKLEASQPVSIQSVPPLFKTLTPKKVQLSKMRAWHFVVDGVVIGRLIGTLQRPSRLYINMFQIHPDLMLKGFGKVCIPLFLTTNPQFSWVCGVSSDEDDFSAVYFWKRCGATFKRCCCCQQSHCDSICLDDGCHFYFSNPILPKRVGPPASRR